MPPVPTVCQPIADEISALEAQDSQLRTQLSTLTGADALAVLSQIASGRETLEAKKAELEACILANTAALQGQVVVIGVGPPTSAESRAVGIIDPQGKTPIQVATVPVQADSFSFAGQLPPNLALTVTTAGDPDIHGPDFRSAIMAASNIPTPARIEIALGPLARIRAAKVREWPVRGFVGTYSLYFTLGKHFAEASVENPTLSLQDHTILASVLGKVTVQGLQPLPTWLASEPYIEAPYVAGLRFRIMGNSDPTQNYLIEAVLVDGWVQFAGSPDAALFEFGAEAKLVSGLRDRFAPAIMVLGSSALTGATCRAFALPTLPTNVSISIRRVSITDDAIEFQPTLGCIGTTLSTFVPPVVPPLLGVP